MNATFMLGKRDQSKRPDLASWFERLAVAGAPGFLPSRHTAVHDVPLIGGSVTTRHEFSPEMQVIGLKLQLGPHGGGLDYERPDGGTVIRVGDDERYLGRPGAPLGVVVGGHVVVPKKIDAELYQKTMGDHERKLGFGELPDDSRFRIHSQAFGVALKLPLTVDVGGARFSLREGNYVSDAKDASVVPGEPILLIAGGVTKHVDPRTGEVS